MCGPRVAHVGKEMSQLCVTRGHMLGHMAEQLPLALHSRSSDVSGPPNSDFESIFGLRIMIPSRTTKTIKL